MLGIEFKIIILGSQSSLISLYIISINTTDVTATGGEDYILSSPPIFQFPPWQPYIDWPITIIYDSLAEGEESFEVTLDLLHPIDPNFVLGERTTLTVIIEDDDEVQPTEPPAPGM